MGPSAGTVLFVVLAVAPAAAYYIPGAYPREFKRGESLEVNVNSLISFHSELPYDFYSLPVCKPRDGVKRVRSTINPGTILVGSRIFNSVYNFTMMEQSLGNVACMAGSHPPLTGNEVKVLKHRIDREYRMRFILDNLPATTYDLNEHQLIRPGVEIGYRLGKEYHLFNHLVFNVLYHRTHGEYSSGARLQPYSTVAFEDGRKLLAEGKEGPKAGAGEERFMVVGFEVMPCSVRRTPGKPVEKVTCGLPGEPHNPEPQPIEEGMEVVYTYDVYFQESSVDWANRWDAYLTMPGGHVHWFSLFNSALVLLVMAAIAAMVLMRTVRRDLQKYEELLIEAQSKTEFQDESGWKLVSGDVLRQPPRMESLVVQAGSGVQILGTCMVTVFFGVLGFLSPASRGSLLTALIVLYLLLAFTAGFSATWLYGYITQGFDRWPLLCLKVSCYYPGIVGLVVTILDLVLAGSGTTGAVPFSTFFSLLALWFIVSIPLSYMGGFIASRIPLVKHPTATNQIPRHIPPPPVSAKPWLLFFAAGLLPFGTIFVELSFAMASMWQGYYYYLFGFMFLVGLLVVIVTAEVAILTTYVQLCAEDYRWWWMSFRRGGSIALYVMLYALGYLLTVLRDFGSLSVMMYLCYMSVMCLGLYLCMGAVGFFTSLWFTHAIFASVKAD